MTMVCYTSANRRDEMKINDNIGNKIKALRESSQLTQKQIADFLGVDQGYISKCEKGERPFNIDMLEKLCNLFGCSMTNLLSAEQKVETLNFAFRADAINFEDLVVLADINKIALNIREMKSILEE
jgi:transcriptional regulator with XRE-family HTH domain